MEKVFVGLGGNIGDVITRLGAAKKLIQAHPLVHGACFSRLYRTTAVSDIPQSDYVNGVCSFFTELAPHCLLLALQEIESRLGKVKKAKNEARPIDIDILLYGQKMVQSEELEIPHPHWQSRLFVLIPLLDLAEEIMTPDKKKLRLQAQIAEIMIKSSEKVECIYDS